MDNNFNHGAEKLIERILSDAHNEAAKITDVAAKEAKLVEDNAMAAAQGIAQDGVVKAETLKNDLLERARISAELDSRKSALAKKRALVEEAFENTERRLISMEGEKRDKLISVMLVSESEGGETVMPSKADGERMQKLLGDVNKLLEHSGKKPLVLGKPVEKISGGFVLVGDGYEKNCSFSAMLREIRDEAESEVADILFI